jgi:chromate reductase, NAD(P)H dehydrogenase (quinone)
MTGPHDILMICGSLRTGSSNEAVLRTAGALAPASVRAALYTGLADLPHFNPDDDRDPLPASVADLRARIGAADALLFCVPEYAGALPGSFKNLLDWTVGGDETGGKPAAWINSSPRGAVGAHDSLRSVLGYTGAEVVDAACVRIAVTQQVIGADGLIEDEAMRKQVASAVEVLVEHVDRLRAG